MHFAELFSRWYEKIRSQIGVLRPWWVMTPRTTSCRRSSQRF